MNRRRHFLYWTAWTVLVAPQWGVAGLATPTPAGSNVERRIERIQQLIPPVLVQDEVPVTTKLSDRMAKLHVPAVSIAVIHDGVVQWARGFGVTRVGGPAVTARTLF